jgi:hypothetical protein
MTPNESTPRTGPRHEPERVYERSADPAEAADRPLEPRSTRGPLADADEPDGSPPADPHHALNTLVGEPDPTADSDPYRPPEEEDQADRASGTRGAHQGAEDR